MSAARELAEAIRELGIAIWSAIEPTIRRAVRWISRLDSDPR